jgi:hypothetical protein
LLKELKRADSSIGTTADNAKKVAADLDKRVKVLEKKA